MGRVVDIAPTYAAPMARPSLQHPLVGRSAVTVLGVLVLVGTFLPWLGEGSGQRSSYELFGVLGRLDIAPNGLVSVLVRGWPVVPLLVTTAIVLCWWERALPSLATALVAVLYVGGVSAALAWFSRGTEIGIEIGVWISAIASLGLLAATLWATITSATPHDVRVPPEAPPADPS